MRVPSGDHTGPDPFVRNRFRLPSAFTIQSSGDHRSFVWSTWLRV